MKRIFIWLTTVASLLWTHAADVFAQACDPNTSSCPPSAPAPSGSIWGPLQRVGQRAQIIAPDNVNEATLAGTIGAVINILLSLMGVVFVVLTIYGGFLWMTARGNEQQVATAQQLIRNSVLGIIIIFSAFAISRFVIVSLGQVTGA